MSDFSKEKEIFFKHLKKAGFKKTTQRELILEVFLKTEGKSPKTHAGVKALFNLNFVKTGLVSTELGRLFARTFQRRQDGDYADMIKFLAEDIEPLLDETEKFINTIKKIIEQ